MSDFKITPVDRTNVDPPVSNLANVPANVPAQEAHNITANQAPAAEQQPKAAPQESDKASLPITNSSNVFLKFKVDEDTKNLTVYVIDRLSKEVLRTIPADEMSKLKAGDLLKLMA